MSDTTSWTGSGRRAWLLGLLAAPAALLANQGRGRGHGHDDDREDRREGRDRYFRAEDAVLLRQYYGGGVENLPPGLRKKYYRTGKLPPGWEKRFRPFPPELVQRLPPLPAYCDRGYVDGYAVVYDRRTRVILDVLDIIGAARGR